MAVLEAFCDDSGTDDPSELPTVAGVLADVRMWAYLRDRWNSVLAEHGVPRWHAAEFEARRGPYEGWSNENRRSFQDGLIRAVESVTLHGVIGCVVDRRAYAALTRDEQAKLGLIYEICALWCVRSLGPLLNVPWQRSYDRERVRIVFEQGPHPKGKLSDAFEKVIRDRPERRLGEVTWERKDDAVELQVADMFAYEVRKHAFRMLGLEDRPIRQSWAAIGRYLMGRLYLLDAKTLRFVLDRGLTDITMSDAEALRIWAER